VGDGKAAEVELDRRIVAVQQDAVDAEGVDAWRGSLCGSVVAA
jgi:hypothetical protein